MSAIYMDYMATTPIDQRVLDVMLKYMGPEACFYNASSSYANGNPAADAVHAATAKLAKVVGAHPEDIIWTSGATESDNLALKGLLAAYKRKGKHLITVATEHKAVLETAKSLERDGYELTILPVNADGLLDLELLSDALRSDTVLVSVMWVNNEIGVIQDINKIAEIVHKRGALLHVDAAQAIGRVEINLEKTAVDCLSICAHKCYGPKGIGALVTRHQPAINLVQQIHGGGGETSRAGTHPAALMAGFAEAAEIAETERENAQNKYAKMRDKFLQLLQADLGNLKINGCMTHRVADNLNVCFSDVHGDALQHAITDVLFSRASACNAATPKPSHVLQALGLTEQMADSSCRFCFGRYTTDDDIQHAANHVVEQVLRLRAVANNLSDS